MFLNKPVQPNDGQKYLFAQSLPGYLFSIKLHSNMKSQKLLGYKTVVSLYAPV